MKEIARYEPNLTVSGRLAQCLKQFLESKGIYAVVSGSVRAGYVVEVNDKDGARARALTLIYKEESVA